jgi:4-hydroxy-4-methyl-2-oxoglutarate aldolase
VNAKSSEHLACLSTPHLADACLRVGVPVRCAPADVTAVQRGMRCAGRALPVRHVGSVDVFLEALGHARPGDVLVVDNGGRLDEACVGDLVALEVQKAGLHGIVIWGLHRDTDELISIGLPLFSLGTTATGPQRIDPRPPDSLNSARVGDWNITQRMLWLATPTVFFLCLRNNFKKSRLLQRKLERLSVSKQKKCAPASRYASRLGSRSILAHAP